MKKGRRESSRQIQRRYIPRTRVGHPLPREEIKIIPTECGQMERRYKKRKRKEF
tara:strand:+ start:762 stop:923 length:162 start_codon:yes stop_codon:yes gene_type:complete